MLTIASLSLIECDLLEDTGNRANRVTHRRFPRKGRMPKSHGRERKDKGSIKRKPPRPRFHSAVPSVHGDTGTPTTAPALREPGRGTQGPSQPTPRAPASLTIGDAVGLVRASRWEVGTIACGIRVAEQNISILTKKLMSVNLADALLRIPGLPSDAYGLALLRLEEACRQPGVTHITADPTLDTWVSELTGGRRLNPLFAVAIVAYVADELLRNYLTEQVANTIARAVNEDGCWQRTSCNLQCGVGGVSIVLKYASLNRLTVGALSVYEGAKCAKCLVEVDCDVATVGNIAKCTRGDGCSCFKLDRDRWGYPVLVCTSVSAYLLSADSSCFGTGPAEYSGGSLQHTLGYKERTYDEIALSVCRVSGP